MKPLLAMYQSQAGLKRVIRMLVALAAVFLMATPAVAQIFITQYSGDFAHDGLVPDNDPGGWQDSRNLTLGDGLSIQELTVSLHIDSAWNGDLYVSLRHQTAAGTGFAVLLNRVGMPANSGLGYGDAGFGPDSSTSFRLSDGGADDVHLYQEHSPSYNEQGQLTGTWRPDGSSFASFINLDPNGTWTLAVIDLSGGDESTILGWGLQITAVPEVSSWLPLLFTAVGTVWLLRRRH